MSQTELNRDLLLRLVTDTLLSEDFRRATFGGVARGENPCRWIRVAIRPVLLRDATMLQFAYFDQKKNVTRNYSGEESIAPLSEILSINFSRVHLSSRTQETDIQITKKGKILVGEKAVSPVESPIEKHNRVKNVPLPEGRPNHVLEVMGVLTRQGQVKASMRAKYTQINEFLKHLTHILDESKLRSLGRELDILDCGCGSSYLTLSAHHYLNEVLGVPARILGVDVNEEVIRKSIDRSQRITAQGIDFACSRIGEWNGRADIVLALHACDTATDDALAQAVRCEATAILSVPCCHHHLNDRLRPDGSAEVLRPMFRHGILQQRTADIVTDAFRALSLRILGYRTDVVEFISPEHTARNLMIRAIRGLPVGEANFVEEYRALCRFWGVTPYIEQALGESFQRIVSE